jgi:hypothetical protein
MRNKSTTYADGRAPLIEELPDATPDEIAANEDITKTLTVGPTIEDRLTALEKIVNAAIKSGTIKKVEA